MKLSYTFFKNGSLSVFVNGKLRVIPNGHPGYEPLVAYLGDPDNEDHDADLVMSWVDKREAVARLTAGLVEVVGNEVFYGGNPVRSSLTEKLIMMLDSGHDAQRWALFLNNLMQNPNAESRECVFNYLERHATPLTEDGCFLAWKYVNEDFTSMHTNPDGSRMDNSPGKVVWMRREDCDSNRYETCSRGLHVCASPYLGGYTTGRKIVMCKVNPRDVVAVPNDYGFQKMRCCEYYVVEEVKSQSRMDEVDASYAVDVGPTPDRYADDHEVVEAREELSQYPSYASKAEFDAAWEPTPSPFNHVEDGSFVTAEGKNMVGVVVNWNTYEEESPYVDDEDFEGEDMVAYMIVWQDGTVEERDDVEWCAGEGLQSIRPVPMSKVIHAPSGVTVDYDGDEVHMKSTDGTDLRDVPVPPTVKDYLAAATGAQENIFQTFERNGITYTARELVDGVEEHGQREYSRQTGIPRSTLQGWLAQVDHAKLETDTANDDRTFYCPATGDSYTVQEVTAGVQELGQRGYSRKMGIPRSTLQGWLKSL